MCIEEHHRCFGLGGYFMAAVLAAASYSRTCFSLCLAARARHVRVLGGSAFHLEPGTIHPCWNLYWDPFVFDDVQIPRKLYYFRFVIEGGGDV